MSLSINSALSSRQANSLASAFEAGEGDAVFRVYAGSMPADAEAAISGQTLLVEIDLPGDAFLNAVAGEAGKTGTWQGTAVASGTATFFRLVGGGGTYVLQGTVSETGGGGDVTISEASIVVGGVLTVQAFSLVQDDEPTNVVTTIVGVTPTAGNGTTTLSWTENGPTPDSVNIYRDGVLYDNVAGGLGTWTSDTMNDGLYEWTLAPINSLVEGSLSTPVLFGNMMADVWVDTTNGSDSNDGLSPGQAKATINAAGALINSAGMRLVVRGGLYEEYNTRGTSATYGGLTSPFSQDGTLQAPCQFRTFPGEHVIIDGSSITRPITDGTDTSRPELLTILGDWWEVEGWPGYELVIRNGAGSGLVFRSVDHCTARHVHVHDTHGSGFMLHTTTNCLLEDCSAWSCYSSQNDGESADGVSTTSSTTVTIRRCLFKWCGDDGVDFITCPDSLCEDTVVYKSGYFANGSQGLGNGNSFKMGGEGLGLTDNVFRRCISVGPASNAFDFNAGSNICYQNTAIDTGGRAYVLGATSPAGAIIVNNLAYTWGDDDFDNFGGAPALEESNSWNAPFNGTAADASDFVNLTFDESWTRYSQVVAANYAKLAPGSDLKGAGYQGHDLGFEGEYEYEIPPEPMETTVIVASGDDDGRYSGGGTFSTTDADPNMSAGDSIWLRTFLPAGLVPGSTINSVVWDFGFRLDDSPAATFRIQAYDTNNAPLPTSGAEAVAQLAARTTAFVDWNVPITMHTAHELSPDASAVLQEIVDRVGFQEGDSMVWWFECTSGGLKEPYSRNVGVSGLWPRVTINWTPPGAAVPSESQYVIASGANDLTYKPAATLGTRIDSAATGLLLTGSTNWHTVLKFSLGTGDGMEAGATASEALVSFTVRFTRTNCDVAYNIYGLVPDVDGAMDISTEDDLNAGWASTRRTTAVVNVSETNAAHTANDVIQHDVTDIINEILAHQHYTTGQDIVLTVERVSYTDHTGTEGTSFQAFSYDGDSTKAAVLDVTWGGEGGGGGGEGLTQQQIADTYLGTDGWALLNQGATPDPSWTTVALGDLQTALSAASNGDVLYLAGGDHDASDGHFSCTAAVTLLGNFDGTTRITGHKDLTNETWTDNGNGTWSLNVGALGLTIRGEDTAASPLQQGEGNARNAWPQMILKNEQIGHHYASVTDLANGTLPDGKYEFPGGGEGYHLDETTNVVSINYDPATADSIYLAYSQGLLHLTDSDCTIKGITFAFDASNNRGPDLHNSSSGPKYAVVVGNGNLLVEYCDADKNHAGGIRGWGGGSMMRNCRFRWNGMNGLNFQGSPRSVLINCEVARNGWTSNSGDVGGGFKMKQVTVGDPAIHLPYSTPAEDYITAVPGDNSDGWDRYGTLVYRIWTHNNYGPGIWFDGDCIWSQIENNLCEDDWGSGILYEICDSGLIRGNRVYRCGSGRVYAPVRGGIALSTSNGTTEYPLIAEDNYVEDCIIGLLMIRASRGTQYELEHAVFRNNHVKTQVPLPYNDVWNETTGSETSPKGSRGTNPSALSMDPTTFDLTYEGNYYEMSAKAFNWENGDENLATWLTRFPNDDVGIVPTGIPTLEQVGLYVPPEL